MDVEKQIVKLHRDLGHKRLNPTWAKLEILLGLTATAIGLLLGDWAVVQSSKAIHWLPLLGSILLIVLGGYLAMAGHRSHIYQSNNKLTAYLVERLGK